MRFFRSAPLLLGLMASTVLGAPYWGDTLTLSQPDGSTVKVRCYGDEYYHRIESLDGFTLTQDPQSHWIEYASLAPDSSSFQSTGVRYQGKAGGPAAVAPGARSQGQAAAVPKHVDLKRAAKQNRIQANRSLLGVPGQGRTSASPSGRSAAPAAAPSVGNVVGLTLLIDFPDRPADVPATEIANYLNQAGYTGGGNNGSVRDYFRDVSGGLLTYTNSVAAYYTAAHNVDYYADPSIAYGFRARELIVEALNHLEATGFDFSTLSVEEDGYIRAINAFYAGGVPNAWAEGIWPHQSSMYGSFSADGVQSGRYQITNIGIQPTLGTFCHENGHMLFGWPDLYDTDFSSSGTGNFDLMAYQGPDRNPVPPNPYLRSLVGWETVTEIPRGGAPVRYSHTANTNASYRFSHPSRTNEFFLIESRQQVGRNAGLPDEGLLVWHIDEFGSNNHDARTPSFHYMVSLEQADGRFDMESGSYSYGGPGDAFRGGYREEFANWTVPSSKWWSGDSSGLNLVFISPVGPTMQFTQQSSPFRNVNVGNPALSGTFSQNGDLMTLEGGGADIWGTADQFFFRYASLHSDGEVVVRLESLENTNGWAKAGLMIRESVAAGARNALLAVTPGNGITFQTRSSLNGNTVSAKVAGTAPRWLKLQRTGNVITAHHSTNGTAWTLHSTTTLALGGNALVGIAVTSHDNAQLATATFRNFHVTRFPWTGGDVGTPAFAGSYTVSTGGDVNPANDVYTVKGSGADIWGANDDFYFLRQPLTGEGRITARVVSLQNTDPWAKAGVMLRENTERWGSNAFMAVTPGNGATFQRRLYGAGNSVYTSTPGLTAPRWVRLEQRGGLFRGYQSADGNTWNLVGEDTLRTATTLVGLAVTSHDNTEMTTAVFDNVTIQSGFPALSVYSSVQDPPPGGDGNGVVNPGEEIVLPISAYNYGTGTARNVGVTLSTTDACFSLITPTGNLGDIPVGTQSESQDFRVGISTGCPSGHNGIITARLTDADGESWESEVHVYVVVTSQVYGTVQNASGQVPTGAEVSCFNNGQGDYAWADMDGSYSLNLPAGSYDCRAYAPDYGYTNTVAVTVPPDRVLNFVLTRPQVSLDRTQFAATLAAGQSSVLPLNISNPGDAPLQYTLANPGRGYAWSGSDQTGGPVYAWTDIRTTGVHLGMDGGMSGAVSTVNLSFAFPYYGTNHTQVIATESGYLTFEDHYPLSFNLRMPTTYQNSIIAGFWDDIYAGTAGAVYFQDFGDRAVFQFEAMERIFGTGGPYTFQIILYPSGVIRFNYLTVGTGAAVEGATVGIQDPTGEAGFTIVHDAAFLHDAQAVEVRPLAQDWIAISPTSGTVAPGATVTVNVTLSAGTLPGGTYSRDLVLTHNSPNQASYTLPAVLTVQGAAAGGVRREVWNNIPGILISDLTSHPNYPNNPSLVETRPTFEVPADQGTDYGDRLRAYITPPVTGAYTFWIAGDDYCELRLSTDEHPGRAVRIAHVPGWTNFREWTWYPEQVSASIQLEAGKRYYIEALHKEGGGGDHVSVGWRGPGITGEAERPIPGTRLTPFDPAAWSSAAIGGPGQAGTTVVNGNAVTVEGGGVDIWGTSDQFRFVYKPLTGDGTLTARVTSVENTDLWAKGGVMIRETLGANSPHAFSAVTAGSGLAFQRRLSTGGESFHSGVAGTAPRWVRITRAGNLFTAYSSTDGASWTSMGSESIPMAAAVWVGLAVTSHNNATLATVPFENVTAP
jgi:M6 family metalloprotease-like protein